MRWRHRQLNIGDAVETARTMYDVDIVPVGCYTVTPMEFDALGVGNHRATLDARTVEDVFPPNDRPRGHDDISSVRHFMTTKKQVDVAKAPAALGKTQFRCIETPTG